MVEEVMPYHGRVLPHGLPAKIPIFLVDYDKARGGNPASFSWRTQSVFNPQKRIGGGGEHLVLGVDARDLPLDAPRDYSTQADLVGLTLLTRLDEKGRRKLRERVPAVEDPSIEFYEELTAVYNFDAPFEQAFSSPPPRSALVGFQELFKPLKHRHLYDVPLVMQDNDVLKNPAGLSVTEQKKMASLMLGVVKSLWLQPYPQPDCELARFTHEGKQEWFGRVNFEGVRARANVILPGFIRWCGKNQEVESIDTTTVSKDLPAVNPSSEQKLDERSRLTQ